MSYYYPVGGVVDSIGNILKGGLDFYGKSQSDAAVADLAKQQAAAGAGGAGTTVVASSGFPVVPVLVGVGALGVVALLLLKKKKTA